MPEPAVEISDLWFWYDEGAPVLQGVTLRKDGSLDEAAVERNLAHLPEESRRSTLVDALNELLYADLLAVKRTLGADHETAIVRELRPPR